MSATLFHADARWIWSRHADRHTNDFFCFRRTLNVRGPVRDATIRITADSRYELHVNGEWIGHGPPKSYLSPWPVDEYDLRGRLVEGDNVVAVLVQHMGQDKYHTYIPADAGLLVQAEWRDAGGRRRVVSDRRWRCRPHDGFLWPVPRISIQREWTEQFDARRAPGEAWRDRGWDDSDWPAAVEVRRVGTPPHGALEPRDIPMLTREPVEPAAVLAAEPVRAADLTLAWDCRRLVSGERRMADALPGRLVVATFIHSPRAQAVQLHRTLIGYYEAPWKLNGRELRFDDLSLQSTDSGVARARLRRGWNVLMTNTSGWTVNRNDALNLWFKHPVAAHWKPAPGVAGGPLLRLWSDDADGPAARRIDAIWKSGRLTEADLHADFAAPLPRDAWSAANVAAVCQSERVVPGVVVVAENLPALIRDNADWATIQPPRGGADVRLLLDFGRETVGYHEFELDAPAGTVVDLHSFEFIQPDGRRNLSDGMSATARYVCREGVQRYRTFTRHGFRYTWVTLRGLRRAAGVRMVRAIRSTYPATRRGAFACSDPTLDRIWDVGVRSVRTCSEDTYTDCPTWEQTHWVGDGRNEALVDLVVSGDPRLSAHSWMQAARSLDRSPLVESHTPPTKANILPAWSFLWMRWAQEHYQMTGDATLARRMLGWLDRNVAGIRRHVNRDGLFEIEAWNMFDWAPMDTPRRGVVTHQNCLAVLGLRQAARLARDLGRPKLARGWDELGDALAAAINRRLWSTQRRAYLDCIHEDGAPSTVFSQQTQTAAFISGVAAGVRARRCREIIERAPAGFVRAGSPFFMFFVLEVLAAEERFGEMLDTIRDYWGPQIEAGATTIWEMYHPDQPRMTRSHCHGWSAAPTFFLSHYVLGVRPAEPGYGTIRIAPRTGGLRWARGRVATPHGDVEVSWERRGRRLELRATSPGPGMRIELATAGRVVAKSNARVMRSPRGGVVLSSPGGAVRVVVEG
ncbi:MAG: hypothetical protein BIFFINMI_02782 [Phycisphaerae bacterium]|nr:hypothetical protein [Phycisphaerae bacterium]